MKFKEKYKIEENGGIVLNVEGDKEYIFEGGFHGCGRAYYGMGIRYGENEAGGVLTLDELVKLRNFINEHLEKLVK